MHDEFHGGSEDKAEATPNSVSGSGKLLVRGAELIPTDQEEFSRKECRHEHFGKRENLDPRYRGIG